MEIATWFEMIVTMKSTYYVRIVDDVQLSDVH